MNKLNYINAVYMLRGSITNEGFLIKGVSRSIKKSLIIEGLIEKKNYSKIEGRGKRAYYYMISKLGLRELGDNDIQIPKDNMDERYDYIKTILPEIYSNIIKKICKKFKTSRYTSSYTLYKFRKQFPEMEVLITNRKLKRRIHL